MEVSRDISCSRRMNKKRKTLILRVLSSFLLLLDEVTI